MVHYVMFPGGGMTSNSVILILQWPWWVVTITTIIIVMIIMIIPLIVVVLYYWMFFFFLWMICCTLKHLWSSVFLRKTFQMEKQNKTKQPQSRLFAPVFGPTSIHFFYRDFCFLWPGISQTWLSNLNMMFTQTNLTFHHDRFLTCAWTVHTTDTLLVGLSAFITSFSDCLLS